ncbi:MAG: glucose-6-phosphate isomerase [bacterium]|nr:glucose-6-phosphate isomerase [bacterium]MBU1918303.1 glucose-6-phosphate isomerase [bacterium]
MKERHKITLDLNNIFQPAISNGLKDIQSLEMPFKEMHQAIMALKQTGSLPYSSLPEESLLCDDIKKEAARYQDIDNIVVLGIGGSALGTASIYYALKGPFGNALRLTHKNAPRLYVIDYIEPDSLTELLSLIKDDKNMFIVISKSGATSETLAQYLFIKKFFANKPSQFFMITDPEKGFLRELTTNNNLPSLPVPPGVGGRFSVFTSVGLFPLAMAGIDIAALLEGAYHCEQACRQNILAQNPAALFALCTHSLMQENNLSQVVMLPYSERLKLFSDWFAQLWGESLGKRYTVNGDEKFIGSTPIKSVGVTDQHSQLQLYLEGPKDKLIYFVDVEDFTTQGLLNEEKMGDERIDFLAGKTLQELMAAEKTATEETLRENNRPNGTIKLTTINEYQLGQLYQLFMNVIPYMGTLLNINAFDQPAVERIKQFTFGLMERKGFEEYKEKLTTAPKNPNLIF